MKGIRNGQKWDFLPSDKATILHLLMSVDCLQGGRGQTAKHMDDEHRDEKSHQPKSPREKSSFFPFWQPKRLKAFIFLGWIAKYGPWVKRKFLWLFIYKMLFYSKKAVKSVNPNVWVKYFRIRFSFTFMELKLSLKIVIKEV